MTAATRPATCLNTGVSLEDLKFELITKDPKTRARRGRLHTRARHHRDADLHARRNSGNGEVDDPDQLRDLCVEILLCNSYHLLLRPGHETVAKLGRIAPIHGMGSARS